MAQTYIIVIEIYVILSIVNAFLGIGQGIYEDGFPGESIRSPFNQYPLGSNLANQTQQVIEDTNQTTADLTNPTNSTGDPIPWVTDAIADFTATIDILLNFVAFFTGGYIIDLLNTMGFPGDYLYVVTVPLGIYVMYMVFVLITNRLGN